MTNPASTEWNVGCCQAYLFLGKWAKMASEGADGYGQLGQLVESVRASILQPYVNDHG